MATKATKKITTIDVRGRTTEQQEQGVRDILSRVRNVANSEAEPITACYYGDTKTGKTRIITTYPGPILVIAVGWERGSNPTLRDSGRDDIFVLRLIGHDVPPGYLLKDDETTMAELLETLPSLIDEMGIKTVAVDTYSMYLQMYKSELTKFGDLKSSYDVFTMLYEGTLNFIQVVANTKVHLIFTAHEDPGDNEKLGGRIGPRLIGQSVDAIMKASNVISRTFKLVSDSDDEEDKSKGILVEKYGMYLKTPPGANFVSGTHFDKHFKRAAYPASFEVFRKLLIEKPDKPLIRG